MEDAIEMELCKIFEIEYKDGKSTLAYAHGESALAPEGDYYRFHFADLNGTVYSRDIFRDDVKGLYELSVAEGRISSGDPAEVIHEKGTALAYYFEYVGSAHRFNLSEPKGYKHHQAKNIGYIKELRKLVRAPVEIAL